MRRGQLLYQAKIILDRDKLIRVIDARRELGDKIVLTSGTFDLVHIGHAKYLDIAKSYGDVLLVGVDSDRKVRERKGDSRPIVPADERTSILSYLQPVDYITIKEFDEKPWELIKSVRPDTLIITEGTYGEEKLKNLRDVCSKWGGQAIVLPRQAETSTSARIRKIQIDQHAKMLGRLDEILTDNKISVKIRERIKNEIANRS